MVAKTKAVAVQGEIIRSSDKCVVASARLIAPTCWDKRAAQLFAADCADRVLPLYERRYPGDARPREAIKAARALAAGEAAWAAWAAGEAGEASWAAWAAAWAAGEAVLEAIKDCLGAQETDNPKEGN